MPAIAPFIDIRWLEQHREDVVVADVRWSLDGREGRTAYLDGHLPGAVFVDLDRDLSDPPTTEAGRHPLPDPTRFAAALGRLGIGDDATVIAYDQGGGGVAARLVWMLRVLGQPAALLDGGLASYAGELETGEVVLPAVTRTVRPWPRRAVASAADAARTRGVVIDARAPERYRGEVEPIDARAGHVPGAINIPSAANVGDDLRLRPAEELSDRYDATRLGEVDDVVVYCGSGVTACHDILALESLGIPARLYPGSWSAWSADPDHPVITGPDPR